MTKKQSDTQPTRPSEGAWRAAETLINSNLVQSQGISNALRLARKVDTAEIIDRETGVAELLEAAKNIINNVRGEIHLVEGSLFYNALKQVIAKCESGTGSE